MNNSKTERIYPVALFREALARWTRNFIPVVAVYGVNVMFAQIFNMTNDSVGSLPMNRATAGPYFTLFLVLLAFVVVNAFISLLVMNFLGSGSARPLFAVAFLETRRRIARYLAALFLLFAFGFIVGGFGSLVGGLGHSFYMTTDLSAARIPVLVATSTVFVVCVIALIWYGCLFSLAPLVAAFEDKRPVAALRESRARVRGNALRYCSVFVFFILLYLGAGLVAYYAAKYLTTQKAVFQLIDPVMSALLGSLWLSLWLVSYQKLTEIRSKKA